MTQTRAAVANQLEQDAAYLAEDHPTISGNMLAAAGMLLRDGEQWKRLAIEIDKRSHINVAHRSLHGTI